ncbi:MAG: class I SAM-dependent methyltransferase [Promethearchaeota archaeon]
MTKYLFPDKEIEEGFALFKKNHLSLKTIPKLIENLLDIQPKDTILDIGAGLGFPVIELATNNSKSQFFAIDYNADYIRNLESQIKLKKIKNIKTFVSEAAKLPFQASFFDKCYSAFTFQDFYENENYLARSVKELSRVSKKSALGVIIVPYRPKEGGGDIWNQISYHLSLKLGVAPHQQKDFEKGANLLINELQKYFKIIDIRLENDGVSFNSIEEAKDVMLKFIFFINRQLWEKSPKINVNEIYKSLDEAFEKYKEFIKPLEDNSNKGVFIPKMNRVIVFEKI